ncbi:MAG: NAD(P)/FAD-dependent oxidoreductase [Alphaproteobacteria bacterium]|nr:NAD(P)/FAD-dependent oxidoreductase [Alphaproteobacteria bacterium]TAD89343.1 MAG: NAD(P)/FAD-dependent oxidoreductase [Alphaproteobacteria bacterium]
MTETRPRVVIVGAGFGGLSVAAALRRVAADVVVIDRRNYHLFQPLLYQVATAALNPSDIAQPIRSVLRDQANATVLMGRVMGIDRAARTLSLATGDVVPFDWLVLATGARHAYFGKDDWEPIAPGLKKIDDATHIRQRVLTAFERAERADDEVTRQRLLTFVVVGAGPTGVELAGAIAELARDALARDFRRIDPRSARVILVDAAPRVLPVFVEELSLKAAAQLRALGVELKLGAPVAECDSTGVVVQGERIEAATVLWAAGVQASPAAKWLGVAGDRAGRVPVGPNLHLADDERIFAIGDTALALDAAGKPLPGIAPVAKQQGAWVGQRIAAALTGKPQPQPFRYRHIGNLATIGRNSAVADFGWLRLSGYLAWVLWGLAHVYFLIGFRNRLSVALSWVWAYTTRQRPARLITGGEG